MKREQSMTFVLVHGAWHGGWCWEFLAALLQAAGHSVYTPTLSGLGERADELGPDIGLETHIGNIVDVLDGISDAKVILVGHSYGGMVVTGVADRLPERIAKLVYLDAAVPENGQSMLSAGAPKSTAELEIAEAGIRAFANKDGVSLAVLPPTTFGVPESHPQYQWLADQLTPHPLKSWLEPIVLTGNAKIVSRSYIHCVEPVLPQSSFPFYAARAQEDETWQYFELETGHDAMVTAPDALADILLYGDRETR